MSLFRRYRLFTVIFPVLLLFLVPWSGETGPGLLPGRPLDGPVNPEASPEARELLQYLRDLSGKGLLSGQHDYLENPDQYNQLLKSTSGKYAMLHGYELGALNGQSQETVAVQRQAVVNSAIQWHEGGGVVAMTFHQSLPGTSPTWDHVTSKLSQDDFNAYVTPGTSQYNSLITELDEVAVYLGELRDAGVPVLWRPYHEMNGDWFWWGGKSNYASLWHLMYERFTHFHKLNNLLWVWNPNAPTADAGPYTDYYPGSGEVDVLAADIYHGDYQQTYYDELLALAGSKPIGIGESGELPDPAQLSKTQSRWVYMMTWGKMLTGNNSTQKIRDFMIHPYVISSDREGHIKNTALLRTDKDSVSETGLTGQYYNNTDLEGQPVLTRRDPGIDFNWHGGSPAELLSRDHFSVRWTGKLKAPATGLYTFKLSADDGVRLWVDGKLVIDSWENRSGVNRTASARLQAGDPHDFKVEYYENEGDASIALRWSGPHLKEEVIPQEAFFLP